MANYQLANDSIDDILITVMNNAGVVVPAIAGDVFTAVSSDTAVMNAVIGIMPSGPNAGAPSLRINALKQLSTASVTATVSDADGLASVVETVDVVADVAPKSLGLNVTAAIHTPQPVPAT